MKHTIKTILAALFMLVTTYSTAQIFTPKWESCFGGTAWDEASGIIQTDSSYWVVSFTESQDGDISYNHGSYDIWMLNIDTGGNLLSEKTFGGSKFDGAFTKILKLNDTVFYIASGTNSTDGDISNNPWPGSSGGYFILKINNHGNILWDKVCGGSNIEQIRDASITNDKGIIAMGISTSDDGDISNHYGSWDIWLIKLDSNGQKQWDKSLGGVDGEEAGSVIQTSDGGYIVTGSTDGASGGNYDTACNFHGVPGGGLDDAWIVKLDSSGNIEWQQCYGGTSSDIAINILELADGYIVLGNTSSNDGDVSGYHGTPGQANESDIWVFKIDFQGNLLWQKCLGGTYWEYARNIFTTTDGGFMIVGTTSSMDGDVVGNHDHDPLWFADIWFTKIDSTGNLLWQYCYGGELQEYLYRGVIQKSDWDYVVALTTKTVEWKCYPTYPPGGGINLGDLRVVELYDSTVGVKEVRPVQDDLISVYPNPSKGIISLKFANKEFLNNASVSIFDINGKLMLMMKPKSLITTINSTKFKSGLYFIKARSKYGVITKKIIIR